MIPNFQNSSNKNLGSSFPLPAHGRVGARATFLLAAHFALRNTASNSAEGGASEQTNSPQKPLSFVWAENWDLNPRAGCLKASPRLLRSLPCRDSQTRTGDLSVPNAARYQLRYIPTRQTRCALPGYANPRYYIFYTKNMVKSILKQCPHSLMDRTEAS